MKVGVEDMRIYAAAAVWGGMYSPSTQLTYEVPYVITLSICQ